VTPLVDYFIIIFGAVTARSKRIDVAGDFFPAPGVCICSGTGICEVNYQIACYFWASDRMCFLQLVMVDKIGIILLSIASFSH
jgi:hypothetical protein